MSMQSAVVELVNMSDLPAKVALNYQSKVVTFRKRQITIPPRQSADLKMDFVPRKINPDYRVLPHHDFVLGVLSG